MLDEVKVPGFGTRSPYLRNPSDCFFVASKA